MNFENVNNSLFQMDNKQMRLITGGSEEEATPAGSVEINGQTKCYSSDYKYKGGCNYVIVQCEK